LEYGCLGKGQASPKDEIIDQHATRREWKGRGNKEDEHYNVEGIQARNMQTKHVMSRYEKQNSENIQKKRENMWRLSFYEFPCDLSSGALLGVL